MNRSWTRQIPYRAFFAVAALALGLGVTEFAVAQQAEVPAPRAIRVSGSATVKAMPDRARLTVAVVSRAATAKAASDANAGVSQGLLAKLEGSVKAPGEVRTAGYDLSPEYQYEERPGGVSGRRLTGYAATNRLLIVTDDLVQVGALIDAAVAAGANEVESIAFYLEDENAARRQALLEAGRRARSEAETVAESLGVGLGPVMEASSESGGGPVPIYSRKMAMMESVGNDQATQVVPGTLEISASVSVAFSIR